MFHILLLILKIIGILILSVIGLFILLLLTVLLVPIRYKVYAEHGKEIFVNSRANWLLHLVNARVTYMEETLHIRVRVLWFNLYDNLKPKPPKDEKKKKRKDAVPVKKRAEKSREGEKVINGDKPSMIKSTDKALEDKIHDNTEKAVNTAKTEGTGKLNKPEELTEHKDAVLQADGKPQQTPKEEKLSIFKRIITKIKGIRDKIQAFFKKLKEKILHLFQTVKNIRHKIRLVKDFLKNEINREGFKITYSSLKKFLKHILPKKLRSRIVFGTGDPCSTGQALGVMSILYSFYGDKVKIIPDFENKVFEGKHYARGRIRLVTILIIVIKLIIDKRFKRLKKNFLILKEAL